MKECALCGAAARMYCESDRASLCGPCDAKVHSANFLVARHARCLLCQRCQEPTPWRAAGALLGRVACICDKCATQRRGGCEREVAATEGARGRERSDSVAAAAERRREVAATEEARGRERYDSVAAAAERRDAGGTSHAEEDDDDDDDFEEGASEDDGMVSDEEAEDEEDSEDEGEGEIQVVPLAEAAAQPPPPSTASSSSSGDCSPSVIAISSSGAATTLLKRVRDSTENIASGQDRHVCPPSSYRTHLPSAPAAALPVSSAGDDDASSSRPFKDRKTTNSAPRWQSAASLPHSPRTTTIRRAPASRVHPS